MKKINLLIIVLLFVFNSCEVTAPLALTAKEGSYNTDGFQYVYNNYKIHIISEPPGAVIEWENQYVGKTPCDYYATGGLGNARTVLIVATPTQSGQYVQRKYLSNILPNQIYFNMNLTPTNPTNNYNIDINK